MLLIIMCDNHTLLTETRAQYYHCLGTLKNDFTTALFTIFEDSFAVGNSFEVGTVALLCSGNPFSSVCGYCDEIFDQGYTGLILLRQTPIPDKTLSQVGQGLLDKS